jgi:DNA-binding protein HU-beta
MTRNDVADALAATRKISKAEARAMFVDVLAAIAGSAAKGEVALSGFGKFSVTTRQARAGRNPRTGEPMFIAASRGIRFRPAKAFKDRVNA